MKQVANNPTRNRDITLEVPIAFSATGAEGLIVGTGFGTLSRCQRVRLTVTGGTAQGFTTGRDFFVIPYPNHIAVAGSVGGLHNGDYYLQMTQDKDATFYKMEKVVGEETVSFWIVNLKETVGEVTTQYWGITTERKVPTLKANFLYITAGGAALTANPNFVGQGDQVGTTATSTWNTGTKLALADTHTKALKSEPITTTGNAGAGTLSPAYNVGGVLYVGTLGDVNVRGLDSESFSVLKKVEGIIPFMVGEIHSVNTDADDIVAWTN